MAENTEQTGEIIAGKNPVVEALRSGRDMLGESVHIVESTYDNLKMTTKEDLLFGDVILNKMKQELN